MWFLLACAPAVPDASSGKGWVQGPPHETEPEDTDTGVQIEEGEHKPPTAVVLVEKTARVGETVLFDGSASFDPYGDDISHYSWLCSDGSTGEEATISVVAQEVGSLSCELSVDAPSGKSDNETGTVNVLDAAFAEWTVMVFVNADNNLESYGLMDFNEMEAAGTNPSVNLVVQMDRAALYSRADGDWTGARRFRVEADASKKAMTSPVLEDLGEVDSGDPQTVIDFVKWAHDNFPANHYALVFWDHGDAWAIRPDEGPKKGISWDDSSQQQISVAGGDLEEVLAASVETLGQPLDLVGTDACIMASWEIAYVMAPYAKVFVASQDFESSFGWKYDVAFAPLNANPGLSGTEIATSIGSSFYNSGDSTLSSVSLEGIPRLTADLDQLAAALLAWPDAKAFWTTAVRSTLSFDKQDRDLGMLLTTLTTASDPDVTTAASVALQDYQALILSNYSRVPEATGLSIFTGARRFDEAYLTATWSVNSRWDDMVVALSQN